MIIDSLLISITTGFNMNSLEPHVKKIVKAIKDGRNVILHGPGGTGKTHTLKELVGFFVDYTDLKIACTATTGVAAINLNIPEKRVASRTLHSWAGIGLGKGSVSKLVKTINQRSKSRERWIDTDVLIIDEISMLGKDLFEKLDAVGRNVRGIHLRPFGGLQIVFSGDFLQLPPVKDGWVFDSDCWKEMNVQAFNFIEPKRYDDEDYFDMLLRVREGECTREDAKKFRARVKAYHHLMTMLNTSNTTNIIKPTILNSRKIDVEKYNIVEMNKLNETEVLFLAQDAFFPEKRDFKEDVYASQFDDMIPGEIKLRVGAQVMLKMNIDVEGGLVNGSRGVITNFTESLQGTIPVVRFINGYEGPIEKCSWELKDKNGRAVRVQIPFILAYALTIHRSQGQTLDFAVCDIGPSIFADGQAYVALSRVRNMKGLFLSDFRKNSIHASEKAVKYSDELFEMECNEVEENVEEQDEDDSGWLLYCEFNAWERETFKFGIPFRDNQERDTLFKLGEVFDKVETKSIFGKFIYNIGRHVYTLQEIKDVVDNHKSSYLQGCVMENVKLKYPVSKFEEMTGSDIHDFLYKGGITDLFEDC